ncbi:MAG: hypothetical protein KME59_05265 [Trichormus sp. ATA11-4-KO1]|jgi:hypothetical protein|nr:hypothetical protein [Trichormus sp. ATA11-4-KO1]
MCNDLRDLLQAAFNDPIEKSRLLQHRQKLQEIINDIPARQWLFEQACQPDDPNQVKTFIITMMTSSRLIWCGNRISPDVYSEALSRTWVWFLEDFCQRYNPEKASFVTWFNQKLRWMILDVIRERAKEEKNRLRLPPDREDNEWIYPPPLPPLKQTIKEWLELVQNNPHLLKNCQMQKHPHVNCQIVLTQILIVLRDSETEKFSWDTIAQNYGVAASSLKRFCRTRCFRIFKQLLSE